MDNMTYAPTENRYEYTETKADPKRLEHLRDVAMNGEVQLYVRSCWVCNRAHVRFIDPEDKTHLLCCSECGKWYLADTDISIYDELETGS